MSGFDLYRSLDLLPGIVLGLTVHEAAHAWMADFRGDPTARAQGRISFDPFRHLDLWGLVALFFLGFGWAKPVQFIPGNLRNPDRDPAWIAAAGPLANVVAALVLSGLYAAIRHAVPWATSTFDAALMRMLLLAVFTNWGLAVFNLLPIPPLDGSHIVFPRWTRQPEKATQYARWGFGALIVALLVQNQTGWTILPIGPVVSFLAQTVFRILGIAVGS